MRKSPQSVWAYRTGFWKNDPKVSEWEHCFHFNKLEDIVAEIKDRELQGNVRKLAIVAHGDSPGVIQLDRNLTPNTIKEFAHQLKKLSEYVRGDTWGRLTFYSCIAGAGKQGTKLLTAVSEYLPGSYVIGFTIYGVNSTLPSLPGQIYEKEYGTVGGQVPESQLKGLRLMNERSQFAKWALKGNIVRPGCDLMEAASGCKPL